MNVWKFRAALCRTFVWVHGKSLGSMMRLSLSPPGPKVVRLRHGVVTCILPLSVCVKNCEERAVVVAFIPAPRASWRKEVRPFPHHHNPSLLHLILPLDERRVPSSGIFHCPTISESAQNLLPRAGERPVISCTFRRVLAKPRPGLHPIRYCSIEPSH